MYNTTSHSPLLLEYHELTLQAADYAVFCCMLTVSALIGIYRKFGLNKKFLKFILFEFCSRAFLLYFMWQDKRAKKSEDVENYLLAGRMISNPIPPALSLTASFMSAITVLGTPVEFYRYGTMFFYCALGYLLVAMLVAHIYIPVLY